MNVQVLKSPGYDSAFHGPGIAFDDGTHFNAPLGDWNRTDGSDLINETAAFSGQEGTYFWAPTDCCRVERPAVARRC